MLLHSLTAISCIAGLASWLNFSYTGNYQALYWLLPSSTSYEPAIATFFIATTISLLCLFLIILAAYRHNHKRHLTNHIYKLAYTDKLTGCRNFDCFCIDSENLLKISNNYSCVSIDIDNFRLINEVNGYTYGDNLLANLADSLNKLMAPDELFCRFHEDAFSMLLHTTSDAELTSRIEAMLDKSSATYSNTDIRPFTFSCGICHIKPGTLSIKAAHEYAVMARSTLTVYHKCICDFAVFDEAMQNQITEKKYFENELYKSISAEEFVLYFQPKYSIANNQNRLTGAEALIRWIHHEKGFLSPGNFIPIFEETGQIVTLDLHIFTMVCQQVRRWLDNGLPVVPISVNISRVTLLSNPALDEVLTQIAAEYKINPRLINLEITETTNCNVLYFSHLLDSLKKTGFTISMDDFGSGYSSFDILHKLPIDTLKLDKTFFDYWNDTNKEKAKGIIRAAVNMSKNLNMTTVAEGAELQEQIDFLKSIECDMVQSYYFAKPMPSTDFADLMAI